MKALVFMAAAFALLAPFAFVDDAPRATPAPAATKPATQPAIVVHFSPHGGAEAAAVAEINGAKHRVRFMAYGFTSKPIALALVAAHKRGVDVAGVIDDSQRLAPSAQGPELVAAGVPIRYDAHEPIMHDKWVTVDGADLITGSKNMTTAGESLNAENQLTLRGVPALVAQYEADFLIHWGHAKT